MSNGDVYEVLLTHGGTEYVVFDWEFEKLREEIQNAVDSNRSFWVRVGGGNFYQKREILIAPGVPIALSNERVKIAGNSH